jgi:hypothetical protein
MRDRTGTITATAFWIVVGIAASVLGAQRFVQAAFDPQPDLVGFFLPAARAVVAGDSPYTVDGYFYSPLVALLLAPFAEQEWVTAYWTALRIVVGIAACIVTAFAFTRHRAGWQTAVVALVAVVTLLWSWPTTLDLWAGQVELIVLFCLGTAAFAESRGSRLWTGFALGMGAVVKTWPALMMVWLLRSGARRRRREWIGVAAAAAAAVVLAIVTGGAAAVRDMVVAPLTGGDQPLLAANSLWGVTRVLFTQTPMAEPVLLSPALEVAGRIVLGAWLVGLVIVILVRPGAAGISLFNIAFVVILLLPVSHYFYVIYALPCLWWWVARVMERPRSAGNWAALAALSIWWVVVFRIAPDGDGFMTTTWESVVRIFAAGLTAVTVSVVAAAVTDRRGQPR